MKHLPPAQLEVMVAIWEAGKPVTRNEIQKRLPDNRWKTTTLNTFLNRLTQNEFLEIGHRGKEYVYTPLIEREAYQKFAGKSILKSLYGNSIRRFIASVYTGEDLTAQEVDELQAMLAKLKEDDARDSHTILQTPPTEGKVR